MKNIQRFKTKLQAFLLSIDSLLTLLFGEVSTNRIINELPTNHDRKALETASRNFNLKKRGAK